MDFKPVIQAISKFAPTVATVLGGPLAGTAVTALEGVFGLNKASTEDLAASIAGATPDQQLQLKKMEQDYSLAIEQLQYADTASARSREVAAKDATPKIIAYLVVAMTITGEGWLLVHGAVPGIDQALLGRIMGTLDSALMLVLGYYFGASHSKQ
jgi:hypothetical protein